MDSILGNISTEQFLSEYWHKKPLLIKGSITNLEPKVDLNVLKSLAQSDEVESRLIEYRNHKWSLERGPFSERRYERLGQDNWTVLVQNVNHHLAHIDALLWRFNFIPYARLDDVMISYAPPGGSVGPHFDSYDVFLLQVGGKKRWQIAGGIEDDFIEDAPIKVLREFVADQTFILEEGDMLYLPPKNAHEGVALEPGMTYSIGFRAPSHQELGTQFLNYLYDKICLDGQYHDADLQVQKDPALIGDAMIDQVEKVLNKITWDRQDVADFLGHYLTEPKPHVILDAPEDELDFDEFVKMTQSYGLELHRKSIMLYCNKMLYCNGELVLSDVNPHSFWYELANNRQILAHTDLESCEEILFDGYLNGYWHPKLL